MRRLLALLAAALASVPLSLLLTFLLTPFWRWLEATQGIESIGHSGPSEWCFVAVYVICLLAAAGAVLRRPRR